MNKLIKISEKGLVSARELYLGLELNKAHWSRWYPNNIEKCEFFKQDIDWIGLTIMENGNETKDFAISLEFAKHIAMMARTEKSHEYRNYFIECEKKAIEQSKPTCIEDILISQLQEMKSLKNEVQAIKQSNDETKEEIQGIREAVTLEPNQWRKDTGNLINRIANKLGGFEHIKPIREEAYRLLNNSYGVDINRRLLNKQKNMALEGCNKTKIKNTNYLDVIAEDKKLVNGYINIVGKLAIKHGV